MFSLPIFTIGATTCAAFSVTLKMVDDEEGYVGKMFIKAFKENLKQASFWKFWLFFWNNWTLLVGILIGPEFIIFTASGISKRIFQQIDKGM